MGSMLALLATTLLAATGPTPSTPDVARLLAESDAAYAVRDEPGKLDLVKQKLDEAEKLAPDDYDVLWRQARYYFWISDDPWLADDAKSKLGKKAWEYGDRATAANPARVEGWNYAASGMGNYSLGIGILRALSQGIEGKFKERLSKAESIDPGFSFGAIDTAWGRFWYKLPWPKYDAGKSERSLRRALERNPNSVRAYVYLADLYEKEDEPKKAREALEKAAASPGNAYDPPEERRYRKLAKQKLANAGGSGAVLQ
jgi:tetratricopeptide (TPR) repeat protein